MNRRPRHTLALPAPTFALAVVASFSAGVLACSDATGPGDGGPVEKITELPRPLSAVEEEVRGASNAFAFDLTREMLPGDPDENLFWSPLSASLALGMLLNGAGGETYEQLRAVLHVEELAQEEINEGYRDLTDLLLGLDPSVTMEIGNSVWTETGFPIEPAFLDRVRDAFDAEAAEVDLGDPATLDRINGWARDATHGRIDPMFDALPPEVVAVLLNAVYFKADWVTRFDAGDTRRAPFTRPDGSKVDVDLMTLEGTVPAGSAEGARFIDLPYGGGAFSMTVVLPDEGRTPEEVAAELTPEVWAEWVERLHESWVKVFLPRFELTWEDDLNAPLQALGMTDAFDPMVADLSRLAPGNLFVGVVKQKSFVKVDERGTEAAAVTGVTIGVTSTNPGPWVFRVDRPFLFVLRERLTGTILFLGVVHDPTA